MRGGNLAAQATSQTVPVGSEDLAEGAASGTSTIYQTDTLTTAGWAADYNDNAPARSVQVLVDGTVVGNATLGFIRPDVASAYNNPAWRQSGWSFSMTAANLAVGNHSVSAIATDSLGLASKLGSASINVRSSTPVGSEDLAEGAASGTSTIYQTDTLTTAGWAADYNDNAPARSVQVLVDGTVVGNATLGFIRPDVASAYNNPAWRQSGWSFSMTAANLAVGNHSVSAIATDSLGLASKLGSASINVRSSTPVGSEDLAEGAASGTSTIYQTDTLTTAGWAADYNDNAPARSVQVLVDGTVVGNATLGFIRPDVASAYNNPAWRQSGWSFSMTAANLAVGNHSVSAIATDSLGLASKLGSASINVRSSTPVGSEDLAEGAASGTSTIYQTDTLTTAGWAADYNDNAPARSVQVLVDGTVVGNATLGFIRPDVASAYNNPAWRQSGWSFSMTAANLAVGNHSVSAIATDSLGLASKLGSASINVRSSTPVGSEDLAEGAASGTSTIYQTDTLTTAGWAADYNDNAPARSVQVLVDGTVVGNATLGFIRPDVASAYNNPAWRQSGWSFSMTAANLAVGNHSVSAIATDSLGLASKLGSASINVSTRITGSLPSSLSVKVGGSTTGTLTLSSAAPPGGIILTLAVDNQSIATAATKVDMPAGATSATFALSGIQAGSTTLRLSAPNLSESDSNIVVSATPAQVIKHIVVIFDENVSFDHYFGTYPVALNPSGEPVFVPVSGTPTPAGLSGTLLTSNPNTRNTVNGSAAINPFRLDRAQAATADQDHGYYAEQVAFHNGAMDQFPYSVGQPDSATVANQTGAAAVMSTNGLTMGYYDGNTVTALWNYAQRYTLGDHFFATNFGPSTPGALNLISGQTNGVVADAGASGSILSDGNSGYTLIGDPDPTGDLCANVSNTVHMTGHNVGDLLTSGGVSWGWFSGGFDLTVTNPNGSTGCGRTTTSSVTHVLTADYNAHHEPFQYYPSTANPNHVRPTSLSKIGINEDAANHQYDLHDFTDALAVGNMPAVSFIKPPNYQEGHAGYSDPLSEQTFLVNTINTIEQSSLWQSTAVVIAYDDSDGWYDHMMNLVNASQSPADGLVLQGNCSTATVTAASILPGVSSTTAHAQGRCGYGPRLPLLLISPWAKPNNVDASIIDQTSITRLIEDTFLSGQRIGGGSFDGIANAMDALFDLTHTSPQNSSVLLLDPTTGLVTSPK